MPEDDLCITTGIVLSPADCVKLVLVLSGAKLNFHEFVQQAVLSEIGRQVDGMGDAKLGVAPWGLTPDDGTG